MGKFIYNANYCPTVNDFLEYYTLENKKQKESTIYDLPRKLEKMDEIYKSNLIEIRKLAKMYELFPKSESFLKQFSRILKLADKEDIKPYAEKIMEIYEYFQEKEKSNSKKDVNFLLELEEDHYFDDFVYAKYFVKSYINFDESARISDFLDRAGINMAIFNRFLNIVSVFDQELYAQYEEKANINKMYRKADTLTKIGNMTRGITEQGDDYDELEYFKNIPFYDDVTAKEILEDFGVRNAPVFEQRLKNLLVALKPGTAARVNQYIYDHKLNFGLTTQKENEASLKSIDYSIPEKGIHIGEDDIDYIISYMRREKIPLLRASFKIARDRYIAGNLDEGKKKNIH